jgi:ribonuclease VapC
LIVDPSALVAIVFQESDAERYAEALADARTPSLLPAPGYLEASIVIDGLRDPVVGYQLDALIKASRIRIEPFTEEQARIARQAYRDFGRGSGHPAKLNFGDCISFAMAKALGEPLLYKGNDFGHTGIRSAL